jgi:hypothetical protein
MWPIETFPRICTRFISQSLARKCAVLSRPWFVMFQPHIGCRNYTEVRPRGKISTTRFVHVLASSHEPLTDLTFAEVPSRERDSNTTPSEIVGRRENRRESSDTSRFNEQPSAREQQLHGFRDLAVARVAKDADTGIRIAIIRDVMRSRLRVTLPGRATLSPFVERRSARLGTQVQTR